MKREVKYAARFTHDDGTKMVAVVVKLDKEMIDTFREELIESLNDNLEIAGLINDVLGEAKRGCDKVK